MRFAYEDMSDDQFERLIVSLCQHLLGIAVVGFSKGPDGGRDAKFVGTAQIHPSTTAPWTGTVIVQAKHTNGVNKSFSEGDFFALGSKHCVVLKEIPRIQALSAAGKLNHYMLFANRRLAANAESEIRAHIASQCGISEGSIFLCGVEKLELLLRTFPEAAKNADLDPIDAPLMVSPDELADVVVALGSNRAAFQVVADDPPTVRVAFDVKNAANGMSAEYAFAQRRKYLKETPIIHAFLSAPENSELLETYESVVDEFQLKIIAKRRNYQSFDEVMEYLTDLLFNRDPVLRANKKLTRAMLFYMYWNCDIGGDGDASADQALSS